MTQSTPITVQGLVEQIPYPVQVVGLDGARPAKSAAEAARDLSAASTVAIGDLHGSSLKLMELLLMSDAIRIPPRNAQELIALQKELVQLTSAYGGPRGPATAMAANDITRIQLIHSRARKLIESIQPNTERPKEAVVLIGDELGDRGPSDPMMMALVSHLERTLGTDRVIKLASNHGHSVLPALFGPPGQRTLLELAQTHVPAVAHFFSDDLQLQASSIRPLQIFDSQALQDQYRQYFKSYRLLHYDPARKVMYSHAPISANNARALVDLMRAKSLEYNRDYLGPLGIGSYNDIGLHNLEGFIEASNRFYRDYAERSFENQQLDPQVEAVLFNDFPSGFLWNIQYPESVDALAFKGMGVETLVHGHELVSADQDKLSLYLNHSRREPGDSYKRVDLDNHTYKAPEKLEQERSVSPVFCL